MRRTRLVSVTLLVVQTFEFGCARRSGQWLESDGGSDLYERHGRDYRPALLSPLRQRSNR